MKLKITFLFLISLFTVYAQSDKLENEFIKKGNKNLTDFMFNNRLVLSRIKSEIQESEKIPVSAQYDSIISQRFTILSNHYISMMKLHQLMEQVIKTREEAILVNNYYKFHLTTIDSTYRLLINRKKIDSAYDAKIKLEPKNLNSTSNYKPPLHASCINSPIGESNCTQNIIRNEVMESYEFQNFRTINVDELRIEINYSINSKGQIVNPFILTSSGFFEYDMEALRVFKYTSSLTFTPGLQDGKPVNTRFTIPIVIPLY
ncbi:energy transducer TonB [Flavobacterium sp.]|uniref:energy transducer TonB n=1 Tax=Flavobacterium sp. TaxID=239 RepID=UPI00262459C8|nr:energy transducer TonB [Flavobacterium sp.]